MMNLDETSTAVGLALGVIALLGAFIGWLRWLRPKWRSAVGTGVAMRDSIVGRDPIIDTVTGRELVPALPGIGLRMEAVERSIRDIACLLQTQHAQDEQLADHEKRLRDLESQTIERVAAKAESVAAWRAVEAVAKSEPPVDPDEHAELD